MSMSQYASRADYEAAQKDVTIIEVRPDGSWSLQAYDNAGARGAQVTCCFEWLDGRNMWAAIPDGYDGAPDASGPSSCFGTGRTKEEAAENLLDLMD